METHLEIKMATVVEEDFVTEEYNERAESFYVQDQVKIRTNSDSLSETNETNETTVESDDDEDEENYRSSLVEKKIDDASLDSDVINSVVGSKSSVFDHLHRVSPATTPGAKKPSRLPMATSPSGSASPTTGLEFIFPSPESATQSRTGSRRAKGSFFTLFVKDKYVSEMFFHSPSSMCRGRHVSLGIFLATSRHTGDHYIYKISPLSPLQSLHLQPQDRILKINGFDITRWAHNDVINFVAFIPYFDRDKLVHHESFTFTFSLEYIPANRPIPSPDLGPPQLGITVEMTMQKNGRTCVRTTKRYGVEISYNGELGCRKFKAANEDKYLQVVGDSTALSVSVGDIADGSEINAEFKIHEFRCSTCSPGPLIAMETKKQPGMFLSVGNNTGDSTLSLVPCTNIQNATASGTKLFCFQASEDGQSSLIRHVASGRYLKASSTGISLLETCPPELSESSFKFEMMDC